MLEGQNSVMQIYQGFETYGSGELLEILSSIIQGFSVPMKKDHHQIFHECLVPLHKSREIWMFQQQLFQCVKDYF